MYRVASHTKQKQTVLAKKLQWFQNAITPLEAGDEKMSDDDEEPQDESQEESIDELKALKGKSMYTHNDLHVMVNS